MKPTYISCRDLSNARGMGSTSLQHQLETAEQDVKEAKAELRQVSQTRTSHSTCTAIATWQQASCCALALDSAAYIVTMCRSLDAVSRAMFNVHTEAAVRQALDSCFQVQESAQHMQADQEARWHSALQAKDAQIRELLSDRDRLEAALASKKGQTSSLASPAIPVQPTPPKQQSIVRASIDSSTLRQTYAALWLLPTAHPVSLDCYVHHARLIVRCVCSGHVLSSLSLLMQSPNRYA